LTEGVHNALGDAQTWLEFSTYPLHEVAVRLHHRLVVIHPWPNGNGRHARLLADIVMAARGGEALTWGAGADLVAVGDVRQRYIEAVRQADQGNIGPLLTFARS
jgi:Fic-DOC domain mobile mystery protein B